VWSPLAGGILTGKYNNAEKIEGSRYGLTQRRSVDDYYVGMAWNMFWGDAAHTEGQKTKLQEMAELATELGCSQA
jgi:aryl-alcohol dehydrogenase-like predicted oxidoreductase